MLVVGVLALSRGDSVHRVSWRLGWTDQPSSIEAAQATTAGSAIIAHSTPSRVASSREVLDDVRDGARGQVGRAGQPRVAENVIGLDRRFGWTSHLRAYAAERMRLISAPSCFSLPA
jgi:hypothetical protein